jgi:hypothetical protein
MKRLLLTAWVLAAFVAWALPADAGEGLITKVRGRTLTIDKGADDGLEIGLDVVVVRPANESIIHPLTGEDLGAPEIEVASGRINKVSARAASIQLASNPIISVRSGDVARFLTIEEKMVMDQEVATETAEQASRERGVIRNESTRLARSISSIQGSIRGLEKAIRDLRRFDDDVVKPQFNAINKQVNEMRDELDKLRETVSLLNAVPVQEMGGEGGDMSAAEVERVRLLIQEEIDNLQSQLAVVQAPPADSSMPPDLAMDEEFADLEEDSPIFTQFWFLGLLGAVGVLGVGFYLYMRMAAGSDEDDEEDEEDDDELVDDDDDLDVEVEEEDDIVVEETS